ncbi:MAG TPA: structural protein P5 [Alphaproteobacteria bacterium]|nr:structural protein P5 [Alphaproteobacteria bacterium]
MATPRGIRNNNPGNLRRSDDHWAGLASEQRDPDFFQFSEPVFGLRALARTLYNYQAKHGLETIRGIIARWAPASENDSEAYVAAVSADMGAGADEPLDLDDSEELAALTKAVVRHENGEQPYSDELIAQAVRIARA